MQNDRVLAHYAGMMHRVTSRIHCLQVGELITCHPSTYATSYASAAQIEVQMHAHGWRAHTAALLSPSGYVHCTHNYCIAGHVHKLCATTGVSQYATAEEYKQSGTQYRVMPSHSH